MADEDLKVFAAARELGYSSNWTRVLLWEGKLPGAYKDETGTWRVPREAVEELKRKREAITA